MSFEPVIACPNCSVEIRVTESLAAPLLQATRQEYEQKLSQQQIVLAQKETVLKNQQQALEEARQSIETEIAEKVKLARQAIVTEEGQKAKLAAAEEMEQQSRQMAELQEVLKQKNLKLEEAQKVQADLLRQQRELDDQKRELDLTVEKRVQGSVSEVREKARKEAEEGMKLKVAEKEEQIASMQRKIEELKQKAEQGSQQLQGEAMELILEERLRSKFPFDAIEPVGKGEFGGDCLQRVVGSMGQPCGAILWELKRTKTWSDGWLPKLRDDQRTAKAEVSILVSHTLPKEIDTFGQIDGVWVAAQQYAIPLAIALRQTLIEVSNARKSQEGQQTKMERVYDYLIGSRFRQRVEAIVEKFTDMQVDLDKEKKSMMRQWAKRQAQIEGVLESTVGMYGDLQGIVGCAIQEIEGLELPLLELQTQEEFTGRV
jgi:hypothetical protein